MNVSKPKYEIIMDEILEQIKNGKFSYDTALCTEKMLSEKYDVSRITAKRAITDLEQRGILYRKRGVGSFVANNALNIINETPVSTADSKLISLLLPFDCTKGNLFRTIEVINRSLAENGYLMSIYVSNVSSAKEKANIKLLLTQNISGLVYYPMRDSIHLDLLNKFAFKGIPIVVIDKSTDCPYIHNVVSDNFEGGRLLTRHLIELGHRHIGFFTTASLEDTSSVRNRFGGYLHELHRAGIIPNPDYLVCHPYEIDDEDARSTERTPFQNVILHMVQSGITAIIAENDRVAQLIQMACPQLGIRIPEDISLVGFDSTDTSEQLGITSIRQDFDLIGEKVVQILLSSFSTPFADAEKICVPVELIVRNSTAAPKEI